MAKQIRQTNKRLRATEDRPKPQPTGLMPHRIDVDRGLLRGLIGLTFVALCFFIINFETARDDLARVVTVAEPIGTGVLIIAAVVFLGVFLYKYCPRVVASKSRLIVFGLLCVTPLAVAKAVALSGVSPQLVPLGAVVFIIALCYGTRVAVTTSFVLAFLVALGLRSSANPSEFLATFSLLGGALVWTFGATRIRKRLWLAKVGVIAAVVQLWLAIGGELLAPPAGSFSQEAIWAAANGVITGAVLTALLPIIEYVFKINTEISLLELSDLNQPLLRRLGMHAPGTYHHSLIVGSLTETAAEAIGANPLLARVGAYFHDIGKLQKPDYFVENEGTHGSQHDTLTPSMSALIIVAHVKDGVEMAEEYNLPEAIVDIIEQHHGTSLMEYFYHRSKENGTTPDAETMFRYPGPRPHTREAAIILLADSVEAASRTLPEPSPSRLGSLVHDLAMKKLLDGQFDDCPLTLTDLTKIQNSFVRVLAAIFHGRVKYPGSPGEPENGNGPAPKPSAAEDAPAQ